MSEIDSIDGIIDSKITSVAARITIDVVREYNYESCDDELYTEITKQLKADGTIHINAEDLTVYCAALTSALSRISDADEDTMRLFSIALVKAIFEGMKDKRDSMKGEHK